MNNSEQDTSNGDSPFKKIFETDWFAIPNFIFEVFDERVSSYHIQLFTLFELENDVDVEVQVHSPELDPSADIF